MKRKSVDPIYSMCVQPSFIIGTKNEDGTDNFAPITWVSVTHEEGDGYLHKFKKPLLQGLLNSAKQIIS